MYAALVTPGSARTSLEDARVEGRRACRALWYFGIGSVVRSVTTPAGWKPGSIDCTRSSARISRPEEISSTTETVTSATTSGERSRSRPDVPARAPSRSDGGAAVAEAAQRGREAEADAR